MIIPHLCLFVYRTITTPPMSPSLFPQHVFPSPLPFSNSHFLTQYIFLSQSMSLPYFTTSPHANFHFMISELFTIIPWFFVFLKSVICLSLLSVSSYQHVFPFSSLELVWSCLRFPFFFFYYPSLSFLPSVSLPVFFFIPFSFCPHKHGYYPLFFLATFITNPACLPQLFSSPVSMYSYFSSSLSPFVPIPYFLFPRACFLLSLSLLYLHLPPCMPLPLPPRACFTSSPIFLYSSFP